MGLSTTTTIFLFVVCLCGGIVIGLMFGWMRKEHASESDEQGKGSSEEAVKQAERDQDPEAARGPAHQDDMEIFRAWQNKQGGIWFEMDTQRLNSREDLTDDQKRRLVGMILYLRPWLEQISEPSTKAASAPAPSRPGQVTPYPGPSTPPPAAPQPVTASKGTRITPPAESPDVSLKSMVEQIDDVLQEKLTGSPFEKLNIRLSEGPGGEVVVQIGTMRHPGIDTIPNPEIQAFIRQAVAEWERRSR